MNFETYLVPKNTEKNTKWAVSTFNAWAQCRNLRVTDKIDPEILTKPVHSTELLCTVLSLFLAEARKVNGERYPPKTLFQLMAGLLRHARSIDPNYPNFLDPKDP